jgi:hypothetical protein
MSSFYELALLSAAGATIVVSILFAGSLAATAPSELTVVHLPLANPTHRCAEQHARPRAEPDFGCLGRPAARQP